MVVGFCPQFSALWPNASTMETMSLFAKLKGISLTPPPIKKKSRKRRRIIMYCSKSRCKDSYMKLTFKEMHASYLSASLYINLFKNLGLSMSVMFSSLEIFDEN